MSGSWSFNNVSLDTYGTVETISGFYDYPGKRGDNVLIPYSDGTVFVQKFLDQRVISIGIAIVGPSMETSLDSLKAAINFTDLYDLSVTMQNGATRTGQAEVKDPILVVRLAPDSVRVIIKFTMPDPYFYVGTTKYI